MDFLFLNLSLYTGILTETFNNFHTLHVYSQVEKLIVHIDQFSQILRIGMFSL